MQALSEKPTGIAAGQLQTVEAVDGSLCAFHVEMHDFYWGADVRLPSGLLV